MKKVLVIGMIVALAAVFAYAAKPVIGTVTAVSGNKVTIELDGHDFKVGDKAKVENGGKDGKFGGGSMKMKGC